VAIVGVGLIGGSIGLALARRGLAKQIVGIGRRAESLSAAKGLGAVTRTTLDLREGVAEAELVVVCTPVGQIVKHVCEAAAACPADTLITDAGSTKLEIVTQLDDAQLRGPWRLGVRFLGSHPLAGNEKKGPEHARADLFEGRVVVITPSERTTTADCDALEDFWTALGARVVRMLADQHDRAVAATSHMPHLVASAIAAATPKEYLTLTAGGWLDTTRIAAAEPALWQQILLANRASVLESLSRVEGALAALRGAVEKRDAARLEQLLTEAKQVRDALGS
jgi:prephenate dehydrogenase